MVGEPLKNNNLAHYRKKKKLSLRQAALYTGCTDSRALVDYEQGNKEPGLNKIARFALTYGASVPNLFPQAFYFAHREIVRLTSLFSPKHYKNTVMVFYPSTYHTGVAIFIPAMPVIAFIRNMSPRVEHRDIIRHWRIIFIELIKEYDPKTLILPQIDVSDKRRSDKLKRIMISIKKLAKKYRIEVIEIVLTTMYESLIPPLLPKTKAQLVPIITSNHPNLKRYELKVKKREIGEGEPYFLRLFMAVALGMAYHFQDARS
jgi:transcriptional regulator with XRE-family HTH domain